MPWFPRGSGKAQRCLLRMQLLSRSHHSGQRVPDTSYLYHLHWQLTGISASNLWPSFPAPNQHGDRMFSTRARNNL